MNAVPQRRPQLTSDELQQIKWLLGGLLTLLAVGTMFYMDVEAWSLMALTTVSTLVAIAWPSLPGRLPALVHTLAFPAIVAFFVGDLWLRTEVLPAMVRLDMLLLFYRSITYRQRRDDLQIIVLGLFLIVVAGVLTVSLTFAVHILIYTACALALLLVLTLSDATAAAPKLQVPNSPATSIPTWAQHTNWRQLFRRLRAATDWRVVGLGVVLFAGVVGVSGLLFLAIPRFQLENSMFLDRFISKRAKSGFSDTIRFGDVTEIQQDNSLALSVDVPDHTQIPAAPYWRMLVLDHYDNGTFQFSHSLQRYELDEHDRMAVVLRGQLRHQPNPVQWTFYLEAGVSRYLPLTGRFTQLVFRESQNFRFAPRLSLASLRQEPVTMTAYRVEGVELSAALPDPSFAVEWRKHAEEPQARVGLYLRLPALARGDDRAKLNRALSEATDDAKLPAAEFARRVGGWLKQNHNYSLTPNIPRTGGDPLVSWLSSRAGGHCELFAGSFVLLARAAGHPARVITGFRGGSWNGYSENLTIRNSDAHAWAEIFDPETGAWLRADPLAVATETQRAEAVDEAAIASRVDRSWKARLDSLRVFWYRRIVSFDQRSQMETLRAVKEATQSSGRRLRTLIGDAMSSLRAWLAQPWNLARFAWIAGSLVVVSGMIWIWREFGREWWLRLARGRGNRRDDPVRREAGRWLRKLTPIPPADAESAAAKAELQRLRFGARATWPEPEKVFRRARRALREARRRERAIRF